MDRSIKTPIIVNMEFLSVNDNGDVDLNMIYIEANPIFNKIVRRDRGSKGDAQGRKKLKAQSEFNFLRMMWHPGSEYAGFTDEKERLAHCLRISEFKWEDIEQDIELYKAYRECETIIKGLASYRVSSACLKGFDNMINFIDNIDFNERDAQRRILFSPKDFADAVKNMEETRKRLNEMQRQMREEYSEAIVARGKTVLGANEMKKRTNFTEQWNPDE